jgi:esterase/lipase
MKRMIGILTMALAMTTAAFGQMQMSPTSQPKAEKINSKQLLVLISAAKTPAEHRRLAVYYEAKAQNLLAQSKEHAQMAEAYKQNPVTSSSKNARGTVDHCTYIAQSFKDSAANLHELAQIHEQMAKDAEQK